MMNKPLLFAHAGLAFLLVGLQDHSVAGVIARHVGANDATVEGWTQIGSPEAGHTLAPVINDIGGSDAWKIDTRGVHGDGKYRYYLSISEVGQLLDRGWSLKARIRLIDVDSPDGHTLGFRTGGTEYLVGLATSAQGDPVVSRLPNYWLGNDFEAATIAGGAGAYHDYELRDPDADGSADLLVDGVLVLNGFTSSLDFFDEGNIVFGDVYQSSSFGGDANYAQVTFSLLPEPEAGALLAMGIVALLCRSRGI